MSRPRPTPSAPRGTSAPPALRDGSASSTRRDRSTPPACGTDPRHWLRGTAPRPPVTPVRRTRPRSPLPHRTIRRPTGRFRSARVPRTDRVTSGLIGTHHRPLPVPQSHRSRSRPATTDHVPSDQRAHGRFRSHRTRPGHLSHRVKTSAPARAPRTDRSPPIAPDPSTEPTGGTAAPTRSAHASRPVTAGHTASRDGTDGWHRPPTRSATQPHRSLPVPSAASAPGGGRLQPPSAGAPGGHFWSGASAPGPRMPRAFVVSGFSSSTRPTIATTARAMPPGIATLSAWSRV